ncbi:MAG: hypothetical protein LIO85_09120 [Rikenellaceae bacterium]|nr:hypothetical protein [Rikenellaceae bacterium]
MGDFKCKSGMASDSKDQNQSINENDFRGVDAGVGAGTAATGAASKYTKSKTESDYFSEDNSDTASQYTKSKSSSNDYDPQSDLNQDSGCGCGSSKDSYTSSGIGSDSYGSDNIGGSNIGSDDIENSDSDGAVIYSETIIFTDPYAGVNNDPATSDLVEDEEEGSEYISSDSNRPQC